MIYILGAIIIAGFGSVRLLRWSEKHLMSDWSLLPSLTGLFGVIGTVIAAIVYAISGWQYIGARYQADIINREYGTHYTQAEVFFASDVIETIRQLQRQRIELNGNLMNGGKP